MCGVLASAGGAGRKCDRMHADSPRRAEGGSTGRGARMRRSRDESWPLHRGTSGAWLLSLVLLGCTGNIAVGDGDPSASDGTRGGAIGREGPADMTAAPGDDGTPGSAGSGALDPGSPPIDCGATPIDPGPSPMRLLTREQYSNTVRDLFGDVPGLAEALGPTSEASAFGLLQPDITQVQLEGFQAAADLIAGTVVQNADQLAAIAPCDDPAAAALDCARAMIESFGARAYRAPLENAADVDRHLALFQAGATIGYAHGVEMLLRGMLQSPRFLYRVELGSDEQVSEKAVRLAGHELAARLSYLVWGTLPDAALSAAVEGGTLQTADDVAAQLARMLEDPRGSTLVRRFLESVAHVSALDGAVKDPEMFPEWQEPAFRTALQDQARSFFDHVLRAEGGGLDALLTSRTVFVREDLGDFYGVTGGAAFEALELDEGRAAGLLTLPALLARMAKPDESSPIYRGKFVREVLLCQQLPAPPANVPKPPEVEPGVSTRERLRQHEVDPSCKGCHTMLDPIGFGFEHFDAIGRYRTSDGGDPVDASGELIGTRDIDGAFTGVAELGQRLAASAEVEECIARQWFRYAISRFEQELDACSMQQLLASFQAADQNLNVLPRAVVATDAFLYRRPVDAEVSP